MKISGIFVLLFTFLFLTLVTQIGGFILLLSFLTHPFIEKKIKSWLYKVLLKSVAFLLVYVSATFLFIPLLAKPFGRVPLPLTEKEGLRPLNFLTCLLNRHYVKPALKNSVMEVAKQFGKRHPQSAINYLDANFPFFDGFPLIPHLSHNDGQKLDLAFCYSYKESGAPYKESPSWIGYGVCEGPREGEENKPQFCTAQGYWQYSVLTKIISQKNKNQYPVDRAQTKELLELLVQQKQIGKVFLEPHLVKRWGIRSSKIRFHGCRAVRHDDHIHIQLK